MAKYRNWTKEEDEKVLKEYKTKGKYQLEKEMKNRTARAIQVRFSKLSLEDWRAKPESKIRKNCPNCNSNRTNEVLTSYRSYNKSYFCMNCLTEFTKYGDVIPPLLYNKID